MRELRRARGFTLDRLANVTGFTKSYLSKIETCKKMPPIGSLARISQALDADIALFFRNEESSKSDERVAIVRAHERQPTVRGGTSFGYDYESLAHTKLHKHMEPFVMIFPSQISREIFFEHEGEEFLFVLSGRVEFEAGDRKFVLMPGDSLYLDSSLPHRGRSLGEDAKALVVIYKSDHATD